MKKKTILPPEPSNELLQNILIISLILGIIISTASFFIFRDLIYDNPGFASIYFSNPDEIPNKVKIGDNYSFDFGIESHELQTKNFTYTEGVELYNLYDLTESRYSCLSRYREDIYQEWTNLTKNQSLFYENITYIQITPLYVEPNYEKGKINWSKYTMEMGFPSTFPQGKLIIFFRNKTDMLYTLKFDDINNEITFNNKSYNRDINFTRGNNKIEVKVNENNIRVYLSTRGDDVLVLNEESDSLSGGAFGFASQDSYYNVRNYVVYKEKPYSVPDSGEIKEFLIDRGVFFANLRNLLELRSRSVGLRRTFEQWNETIDCLKEPFYCEYFDLENDISFYVDGTNLTKVAKKVPVEENINYILTPIEKDRAVINWTNYTINMAHTQIRGGSKGAVILKVSDKWAFMITRNNTYWFEPLGTKTRIDEIRNPKKANVSLDVVDVDVNQNFITLYINNKTIFQKETPHDYRGGVIEVYIKNDFLYMSPIKIINNNPDCKDPLKFEFCELTLETSIRRTTTITQQESNYRIDYVEHSFEKAVFNLFDFSPQDLEQLGLNLSMNETLNETINITQIKKVKTPVLNLPVYNPFIPDRRIVMNTPNTLVQNATNFSIEYSFVPLDGAYIYEAGIADFAGNEILSMYVLARKNQVIIYNGVSQTSQTINVYINKTASNSLKFEIQNGDAMFYLDRDIIHEVPNTGIKSGQLFIGSRNTYLDMRGATISIEDSIRGINIREDECELKLIYREEKRGNLTLAPDQTTNIRSTFSINQDFDYGKVFVELYGSTGTNVTHPLEVHFWVIRNDN